MFDCGHRCCEVPDNQYHVHADEPARCGRCVAAGWGDDGAEDVPRNVAAVLDAIVPPLPARRE
jgi:hypothetical protein